MSPFSSLSPFPLPDGDFDRDGNVNAADLDLMFAQYWLQVTVVS